MTPTLFVVAGASGRTGRVVARTLLDEGQRVRVLVRDEGKAEPWRRRGAEVAVVSLGDAAAVARAVEGATGLYAILPEEIAVPDFHAHRRRMADALAAAVKAASVPRVVMLSASAAALPDGNGPAKSLHHAENALRASGTRVTAIHASFFQENVLDVVPAARAQGIYPCFLRSADVALPTNATRDVGSLAARCLLEPPPPRNEIVDLVGPAYSTRQLAEKLGGALGKSLRVVEIPAAAHADVLVQAGLPRAFAEVLAEMYACLAAGRVSPCGDRTVTATTTLDEILPELLAGAPPAP